MSAKPRKRIAWKRLSNETLRWNQPFPRSYLLYPRTISVSLVKFLAISFSQSLLTGLQLVSVITNQSYLLALIPTVNASFLWLIYLALSGVKVWYKCGYLFSIRVSRSSLSSDELLLTTITSNSG